MQNERDAPGGRVRRVGGERRLARELLLEQVLEGLAVLVEPGDTLVELVVSHLVVLEVVQELLLVVDERDLQDAFRGRNQRIARNRQVLNTPMLTFSMGSRLAVSDSSFLGTSSFDSTSSCRSLGAAMSGWDIRQRVHQWV